MSPIKLVAWVALLIAVVGAFTEIPYSGAILLVLGLAAGAVIAGEDHVRVLVTALVLNSLAHAFNEIPEVGKYLASIFAAVGVFAAGAALTIISRNVWNRYKP
ncbi:MAG: hypothetical protein FJ191_01675 [Gammaproteobacteria bacterium]|nr:hypothetical protein [Gammaproteobacteria bacterium]